MKKKGDRMVPNCVPVSEQQMEEDLRKWFKEKWVRFGPDGKIRGDCARGSESEGKPKCLPQAKAHALGKKGRASAAAKKRREDPNPERRGPAKNVATKVKEGFEYGNQVQHPKYGTGQIIKVYPNGMITVNFPNYPDPIDKKPGVQGNFAPGNSDYQSLKSLPNVKEATGDPRFDTMMGRIVDPVAALSQDRVYEEQLEDYVFAFMNEFLGRMDRLGIEVWLDDPRAGEDLTNPKFLQAYEQASVKAVQRFMQRKKLDVNNQQLVAKVKADFDENADQVNPVAGFLGAFMQGFTVLRPGEIDVLNKSGMLKKPGDVNENNWDDADEFDEDDRLRDGDYVRDSQDGEYGEVFRMSGDPTERRVRILDRDGRGWYISPERLVAVDRDDPAIQKYFGKKRQRDMDEQTTDRTGKPMYQAKEKFLVRHNGKDVAFFPDMEQAKLAAKDIMKDLKGFATVHRVMREYEIKESQAINEKQDACYRKVKSRYKVWPSAYASGALVQCRKKGAANWGTGSKKK
jgi:hypothetical protein